MCYETQEKPDVSQPPTQPLVDQVVEPSQYLVHPTLLSESDPYVIEPIPYLVNPTLPSESDFDEAVESIPLFLWRVKCLLVTFSSLPVQILLGALNLFHINPHQALGLLPLIGYPS